MFEPKEVSQMELVFGGNMSILMITMKDIPKDFHSLQGTEWNKIIARWFFGGLPQGTKFIPKEGIDKNKALRHLKAIMGSFEPKHEHKEACCAYLLSLWFEKIEIPKGKEN